MSEAEWGLGWNLIGEVISIKWYLKLWNWRGSHRKGCKPKKGSQRTKPWGVVKFQCQVVQKQQGKESETGHLDRWSN